MKVGITEVADRARVSEATVSRVINRRQGVSRKTRETVEHAMAALGYERQTRGQLIAVITELVSNPFFADVSERIESTLAPHGLKTVLCPCFPGGVQELDFITALADRGVAAVVFLSASNTIEGADPDGYELLRTRRIPFVGVNGQFVGAGEAPVFSTDDLLAAELAVDHLYRLGHRRIGMASGPVGNRPADRRVSGFVSSLAGRGVEDPEQWVIRQSYTVEGGQSAAVSLLGRGATAIVAASDYMALGAIRGARRQGYDVPGDVSVVGYDGTMIMDFVDPPLTTVRQPADRLASEVARSILALVGNRDVPAGELLFDPELVIRASTAAPRTEGGG